MIQPFFDFIEKFATDFSWRRLIILFSLIFILGFVYFLYESQTATSQLSKYERSIEIIKQAELINPTDSNARKIITNIFRSQ